MKVEQDKVVSLSYRLETDGDLVEEVTKDKPMQFVYGEGFLLPKFEEQIANMSVGDKFEFVLQPAEAYGEIEKAAIIELPKNVFEIDGNFDDQLIQVGRNIPMQDQEGNRLYGIVEEIGDSSIRMNFNHPLAGNVLHFAGEIVAIREMTPDDLMGKCSSCGCHSSEDCDCDCEDDECDCDCNCDN
jgi:FKBP-type peptidyl-prolyl cis-trans isomerase SlyD